VAMKKKEEEESSLNGKKAEGKGGEFQARL
jgi:hypothetical protein